MEAFILELATKYPAVMAVCLAVTVFRAIFKPAMTLLEAYVRATPTTSDDAAVEGFKAGKIYKALVWIVDYTMSIKIPTVLPDKK